MVCIPAQSTSPRCSSSTWVSGSPPNIAPKKPDTPKPASSWETTLPSCRKESACSRKSFPRATRAGQFTANAGETEAVDWFSTSTRTREREAAAKM